MDSQSENQVKNAPFFTPRDMMAILKLSREAIYRMLADGEIPGAVKIGYTWRVDSEAFWSSVRQQASERAKQGTTAPTDESENA